MSNQLQIESYRISMRKLRTFYWKVTEFLNDDKILCSQRLGVNVRTELYRRAGQTVYLYSMIGYLCKKAVRMFLYKRWTESPVYITPNIG